MDKNWMKLDNRKDKAYELGVANFLDFAYSGKEEHVKILCPCRECNNFCNHGRSVVEDHLFAHGIRKSYTRWIHHGEQFRNKIDGKNTRDGDQEEDSDFEDLNDMLSDIGTAQWGANWGNREESMENGPTTEDCDVNAFLKLFEDAKKELYPGNKFYSKLSFVVTLLHLKTMSGWSIKSFNALLEVFKNALPPEASVPKSFSEAKKIIRDLGFKAEKIHACVNNCVLFRKEYANLDSCPNQNCKKPRYKSTGSKVPRKVLHYFPLKPRLQRLYVHKEIALDMRWHKEKRMDDGNIMRHPARSEAWKNFDRLHPEFAQDPRNVRLGLATDGFNPFGSMTNSYSIWPIFLVPYNLPPWKCMKDPFFFMSMLIPGPKSPGNELDVYMGPLIEELGDLWLGIETHDAYTNSKFKLRAALLWTINDFPAYAMLSGWSTKGYKACPICMAETSCVHLKHGRKLSYTGHRRFLPINHRWRREKKTFDGKVELRNPIVPLSGEEILQQVHDIEVEFGKTSKQAKSRKRKRAESGLNWTKKSCFFQLPYWADLKFRHNLDIMHIVKNVSEAIFGTIMDIDSRTKDTWLCRKDLADLGLKKELHLIQKGGSYIMPLACYNLTKEEQRKVCNFLASVKYPDGFASNISRCIKNGQFQISGMKSHDFHIFIQRILPLAIRGSLTKEVRQVLFEVSDIFKKLCARTLYKDVLEELERIVPITLCKLERLFPPSLFDVMMHLMVHLPCEAILGGPAQYRWIFPFEKKMGTLKSYVRNKARPEGCIVERYIDKECLTFCSMYLDNVETIFNRPERNNERISDSGQLSILSSSARPFGGPKLRYLPDSELARIHAFLLNNCDEIEDYINEHKVKLEEESPEIVEQRHDREFPTWFRERVLYGTQECNVEIRSLALGLDNRVSTYSGCMVNGYRFHTQECELQRKTQNSGVVVKGEHGNNMVDFYGVIKEIIQVEFWLGKKKVLLLKCDWWKTDNSAGLQIDRDWNITSVNSSRMWYRDQPYVLPEHVEQVFYVPDLKLGKNWFVVERFSPRNYYDVPQQHMEEPIVQEVHQEEGTRDFCIVIDLDNPPTLAREDRFPLKYVPSSTVNADQSHTSTRLVDEDFIDDGNELEDYEGNDTDEDEFLLSDDSSDSN